MIEGQGSWIGVAYFLLKKQVFSAILDNDIVAINRCTFWEKSRKGAESKYETKIFEKALFIFAGKCNGIDYVSDI